MLSNPIAYFALRSNYFAKHSADLRKSVDDHFKTYFETQIEEFRRAGTPEDIIGQYYDLDKFVCDRLYNTSVELLCRKGESTDLLRVRGKVRTKKTISSMDEIEYFRKHGEWVDIKYLANAKLDYYSERFLGKKIDSVNMTRSLAKTILHIAKDRTEELLAIDMLPQIKVELISAISLAKFRQITDESFLQLLDNEEAQIRKTATIKGIQAFPRNRIKDNFNSYFGENKNNYYNVLYWLDFGISIPKTVVGKAIKAIYD